MLYLNDFKNFSEYESFVNDFTMENVTVSFVEETGLIYLNGLKEDIDYNTQYLTMEAVTEGQFGFVRNACKNVKYSLDNGSTWVDFDLHYSNVGVGNDNFVNNLIWTPILSPGQKVLWKGEYDESVKDSNMFGVGFLYSTGDYNLSGNALSLTHGDNFIGKNETLGNYFLYNLVGYINIMINMEYLQNGEYDRIPGVIDASNFILPSNLNYNSEFYSMFASCTKLINAPKLPATTLSNNCYTAMFQGCTSLTTVPELPATTLTTYCYYQMFRECTSLTKSPVLPATTLVKNSYSGMFRDCTNLSEITMLATDISATSCLTGWVSGVSSTGTFIKHPDMTSLPTGVDGIPSGWEVVDYQG